MKWHLVITASAAAVILPGAVDGRSSRNVFAGVSNGVVVVTTSESPGLPRTQGSRIAVGHNEVVTNGHVVSGRRLHQYNQAMAQARTTAGTPLQRPTLLLVRDSRQSADRTTGAQAVVPTAEPSRSPSNIPARCNVKRHPCRSSHRPIRSSSPPSCPASLTKGT